MSFDVMTLALAKSYTDQQQVRPDWNQNDPQQRTMCGIGRTMYHGKVKHLCRSRK